MTDCGTEFHWCDAKENTPCLFPPTSAGHLLALVKYCALAQPEEVNERSSPNFKQLVSQTLPSTPSPLRSIRKRSLWGTWRW